jgi:hypothetical protein
MNENMKFVEHRRKIFLSSRSQPFTDRLLRTLEHHEPREQGQAPSLKVMIGVLALFNSQHLVGVLRHLQKIVLWSQWGR